MQFHVGQKVVCINDRWANGRRRGKGHETMVKAGVIYTVREVVPGEPHGYKDGGGLRVREIVNRPDLYHPPAGPRFCEAFFCGRRFFPLQTTNIDVFLEMLAKVRITWAEDVEAEAWMEAFKMEKLGNEQQ